MAKSGRWQPLAGDRLAKHRVIRTQWFQDKPDQWSSSQSSRFRLRAGTEGSEPRADPACERNPKAGMSKITVFRVKFYDGRTNEFFYSSHVATREWRPSLSKRRRPRSILRSLSPENNGRLPASSHTSAAAFSRR